VSSPRANGNGHPDELASMVEDRLRALVRAALDPANVDRILREEMRAAVPAPATPEPEVPATSPTPKSPRPKRRKARGALAEALVVGAVRHRRRLVAVLRRRQGEDAAAVRVTVRCQACRRESTVQASSWYAHACPCSAAARAAPALARTTEAAADWLAGALLVAIRPGESMAETASGWVDALPVPPGLRDPRALGNALGRLARSPREGLRVTREGEGRGPLWRVERVGGAS
jgi:hypothetical protein